MKVAFITSRFPYPIEKGDKLRAYHHIRYLSRKYAVHLFAITHAPVSRTEIEALEKYCATVHVYPVRRWLLPLFVLGGWLRGLPLQVAYFLDPRAKRRMQTDIIALNPGHIIAQLIRTTEYVRAIPLPKTLDYMDTFSIGAQQRARSGPILLRPFYTMEAGLLRRYERGIYGDFTHHMIISGQDRDRLSLPYRQSVRIVPNGVDIGYFAPLRSVQKWEIVFVGNLGYLPNIEAAEFLIRKVMPLVWSQRPGARVCLVGARPHGRVQRLQSPRVEVTGWVDDVRPYYAAGSTFVAPIFSGMGQQNKILEAMAMGRPCVTTAMVDNAIAAGAEEALRTAESPQEFAAVIMELIDRPEMAERIAQNARKFVTEQFSWSVQTKAYDRMLTKAGNTFVQEEAEV